MIGISGVGTYIPEIIESNLEKLHKFSVDENFIYEKIGFINLTRKKHLETPSDLAYRAFSNLIKNYDLENVECVFFCTQNGDHLIPHTAAIMQHRLGLPNSCAAFDISMSCSGYVYSLHIAKAFMESNGFKTGLLFTADSYSEIIAKDDKNTNLLFGDAATVTLLTDNPAYLIRNADFITSGDKYDALIRNENSTLKMNGRAILNFCLENVINSIRNCLRKNSLSLNSVDLILLHQASKFIVDMITKKIMETFPSFQGEIPFRATNIGNTVSSSIPILLKDVLSNHSKKAIILCGFGGGLSIATTLIEKAA